MYVGKQLESANIVNQIKYIHFAKLIISNKKWNEKIIKKTRRITKMLKWNLKRFGEIVGMSIQQRCIYGLKEMKKRKISLKKIYISSIVMIIPYITVLGMWILMHSS